MLSGCGGEDAPRAALHEPCCTEDATTCDAARFHACAAGLSCYVMPHAMYYDTGICCDTAACSLGCDTSGCVAGCAQGEQGCPPLLTCRHVDPAGDYCLP